ncbi:hypothetical protein J5I95_21180 [Candidatus Poribacteria bacterium]|nr:hypothetical protein [Candidatus Poribacteria bacterium]
MLSKGFVIPVLLVGMMLLSVAGCGDDVDPIVLAEEKTEKPTLESSVSPLANEELLGSWEVVSIFGRTPEEFFEDLAEDEEPVEKVKQFTYVFADNSWTCNFRSETVFIFDDIPPGKTEKIGAWSGTYVFDGLTLSLFQKGSEVHIAPEPKNFFQVAFGRAVAEVEQDFDEFFSGNFIKPFAQSACTKQGGTLVLVTADGEEMVLEKQ